MTLGGWILMISSNAFVLALTGYCFVRVLGKQPPTDLPPTL